jgi:hypothetical protein
MKDIVGRMPGTATVDKQGRADAIADMPGKGAYVFRWITQKLHTDVVMATLLMPGGRKPSVEIAVERGNATLRCAGAGLPSTVVRLSRTLKLRG